MQSLWPISDWIVKCLWHRISSYQFYIKTFIWIPFSQFVFKLFYHHCIWILYIYDCLVVCFCSTTPLPLATTLPFTPLFQIFHSSLNTGFNFINSFYYYYVQILFSKIFFFYFSWIYLFCLSAWQEDQRRRGEVCLSQVLSQFGCNCPIRLLRKEMFAAADAVIPAFSIH